MHFKQSFKYTLGEFDPYVDARYIIVRFVGMPYTVTIFFH